VGMDSRVSGPKRWIAKPILTSIAAANHKHSLKPAIFCTMDVLFELKWILSNARSSIPMSRIDRNFLDLPMRIYRNFLLSAPMGRIYGKFLTTNSTPTLESNVLHWEH
jgi:hypothetical protein